MVGTVLALFTSLLASTAAFPASRSRFAADVLQRDFFSWYGLWDCGVYAAEQDVSQKKGSWWNCANSLEALANEVEYTKNATYSSVFPRTWYSTAAQYPFHKALEGIDDIQWWALAWLRVSEVTGDPSYLTRSRGIFDEGVARKVLASLSADHWRDDGTPANASGHLYKVLIPVHRNRSIETIATLLDAHNNVLLRFRVRAHGYDADASGQPISNRSWPDLNDNGCPDGASTQGCVGLNEFSSYGNTPTGLSEIDLNSPEDSAKLYGPYPVNRFVRGMTGNAQFLLSPEVCSQQGEPAASLLQYDTGAPAVAPIRSGILLHTGAWAAHSSWTPAQPMPNSEGCVHAHPDAVHAIWQKLRALGVAVRNNTQGRQPYPYVPQGLAAVYEIDDEHLEAEMVAAEEGAKGTVRAVSEDPMAPEHTVALASAPAPAARQWVFGNHSGGSAFEVCATQRRVETWGGLCNAAPTALTQSHTVYQKGGCLLCSLPASAGPAPNAARFLCS